MGYLYAYVVLLPKLFGTCHRYFKKYTIFTFCSTVIDLHTNMYTNWQCQYGNDGNLLLQLALRPHYTVCITAKYSPYKIFTNVDNCQKVCHSLTTTTLCINSCKDKTNDQIFGQIYLLITLFACYNWLIFGVWANCVIGTLDTVLCARFTCM